MKLVVDANILFSFFKKESFTRKFILSHPELELFTSEYVFEELEKYKEENAERVEPDQETVKKMGYKVIGANIIDAKDYIRHDSHRLSRIIMNSIGEYTRRGTL